MMGKMERRTSQQHDGKDGRGGPVNNMRGKMEKED